MSLQTEMIQVQLCEIDEYIDAGTIVFRRKLDHVKIKAQIELVLPRIFLARESTRKQKLEKERKLDEGGVERDYKVLLKIAVISLLIT